MICWGEEEERTRDLSAAAAKLVLLAHNSLSLSCYFGKLVILMMWGRAFFLSCPPVQHKVRRVRV